MGDEMRDASGGEAGGSGSGVVPAEVLARRRAALAAAQSQRGGSAAAHAALLVANTGVVLGGFFTASGLATTLALIRLSERGSTAPPPPVLEQIVLFLPIGVVLSIVATIARMLASRAYYGAGDLADTFVTSLWPGGATLGASAASLAWWVTSRLERPPTTPWYESADAAMAAAVPWLVPVFFGVWWLKSASGNARRVQENKHQDTTLAEVFLTGTRTPGTVEKCPTLDSAESAIFLTASWTVSFVSTDGQRRVISRMAQFRESALPSVGDTVTVLYDTAHPARSSRTFIAREDPERVESYTAHRPN